MKTIAERIVEKAGCGRIIGYGVYAIGTLVHVHIAANATLINLTKYNDDLDQSQSTTTTWIN